MSSAYMSMFVINHNFKAAKKAFDKSNNTIIEMIKRYYEGEPEGTIHTSSTKLPDFLKG
jgi:transposase